MLRFFLAAFTILSLALSFAIFIIMCLGVGLFGFNVFVALCAPCVLIDVSFQFGQFSPIISPNIFSTPFSFSSPGIPFMQRLPHFVLSHRSLILILWFFFPFGFCLLFCLGDFHYSIFHIANSFLCNIHSAP